MTYFIVAIVYKVLDPQFSAEHHTKQTRYVIVEANSPIEAVQRVKNTTVHSMQSTVSAIQYFVSYVYCLSEASYLGLDTTSGRQAP